MSFMIWQTSGKEQEAGEPGQASLPITMISLWELYPNFINK